MTKTRSEWLKSLRSALNDWDDHIPNDYIHSTTDRRIGKPHKCRIAWFTVVGCCIYDGIRHDHIDRRILLKLYGEYRKFLKTEPHERLTTRKDIMMGNKMLETMIREGEKAEREERKASHA